MIKSLRIKFIRIAMSSIAIVLFIIMAAINIANFVNVNTSANERIGLIADNGGYIPEAFSDMMNGNFDPNEGQKDPASGDSDNTDDSDKAVSSDTTEAPAIPGNDDSNPALKNGKSKDDFKTLSAETPYDTRYFSVSFSSDGSISEVNLDKIAAISEDTAEEMATKLYSKRKTSGFYDSYKYYAMKTTDSDGNAITLYIFLDCQEGLLNFRYFLIASVAISAIGLLLVFLLVLFFSNLILKPVAESYTKQKRFITDASHEIKTPLTIIDANTEIIEMEHGEDEWTESTRNQIKRLTDLTNKLVFLSRMDEESETTNAVEFNLSDAVIDTAEPFKAVAKSKDKILTIKVEEGILYKGDEGQLRQATSLLVDNAVKYATEGTEILLCLKQQGRNRILTIENKAEGIAPGKHDELFERFYRPDASRNSKTGGHGIGLSVVWAIVNAHKGKITAKSEDGTSLLFTITLS